MRSPYSVLFFVILAIVNIIAVNQAQAQSTPTPIYNCHDLQSINNNLGSNYQLANDIDCSGTLFTPIAPNNGPYFTGSLDGQGHTIRSLTVQSTQIILAPSGLFGAINGGSVSNLHIVSASIIPPVSGPSGNDNAGILAGAIQYGYIRNVTVQGSVSTGKTAGGLAGDVWQTSVSQSSADAMVSGSTAGGLVGYDAGNIDQCYSKGTVIGSIAGGLIGIIGSVTQPDLVQDSYSHATVITTNDPSIGVTGLGLNAGGLVGINGADYGPTVVNSYANGPVLSQIDGPLNTTLSLGGDQGSNYQFATWSLSSIYWDVATTQQLHSADSPDSNGKSTAQMLEQVTYYGWDFVNTWVSDAQHFPILLWQEQKRVNLWNTFSAAFQESIYDQAPPNTVNWSNLDNLSSTDGINWSDLLVMSRPPVWSYQSATATSGYVNSVNWTYLGGLVDTSINWGDVYVFARSGIDWKSVNPLVKSGINWSDWVVSTTSGINWNDLVISSRTGINWDTLSINDKAGTNWPNWAAMTKIGVNWFDVSVLSNLGINWNNIGTLGAPINLSHLAGMTKQGINWGMVNILSKENVNWDSTAILNAVPMTPTDLHTLRTIGLNTNGTSPAIPTAQLTLNLTGYGAGAITSVPEGIYCATGSSGGCSASFPLNNRPVTLNFISMDNSSVTNWGGCTQISPTSCTVTLDQSIVISIAINPAYTITTSTAGPGSGKVLCNGSACPASVPPGTVITFTGQPDKGSILEGLGGVCAAPGGPVFTCPFDVTSNINVSAYFIKSPPPAPTNLIVKSSPTGINLSWNNKYGVSFNVYRAETGVNGSRYTLIKYVGYPNTTYTDTTMPNDGLYNYYVTGVYYPNIESPRSNIAAVHWIEPNIPSTPTGLKATTSAGQVALSWNTVPGADAYYIKRAVVNAKGVLGPYITISVTISNPAEAITSFTDRSVSNGKIYYYIVAALNDKGTSAYTSAVSIKAK